MQQNINKSWVYFLDKDTESIDINWWEEVFIIDIIWWWKVKRDIQVNFSWKIKYFLAYYNDVDFDNNINFNKGNCEAEIKSLFLNKEWKISGQISTNINSPSVQSNISMKAIVCEKGFVEANWNVKIEKDCINSAWYLSQENIFLADTWNINITPRLDIYCNQVKASHWAKISKIDPFKVFYTTSKWISKEDCTKMIINWYISEFFEKAETENSKWEILDYILS